MKFLLVSPLPPDPPNRGSQQRTRHLHAALADLGEVDLVLTQPPVDLDAGGIERLRERFGLVHVAEPLQPSERAPWRFVARFDRLLARRLAHNLSTERSRYRPEPALAETLRMLVKRRRYDLVVSRYVRPFALSGLDARPPVVIDVDDLDTQTLASRSPSGRARALERFVTTRRLALLRCLLPPILDTASHLWVASSEDISEIRSLSATSCTVLPNIPYVPGGEIPPPFEHSPSRMILAVCSMNMSFNRRGVERFVERVFPSVRRAVPEATLVIVGSRMSETDRTRWTAIEGVEALGTVAELEPLYERCQFAITPVFEGGGSKIKVIESLLYGRTQILTEHARRGYEDRLEDGRSLLVATDDAAFASACIRLLRDDTLCARLAASGHRVVAEHFGYERFREIVQEDIGRVIETGAAPGHKRGDRGR